MEALMHELGVPSGTMEYLERAFDLLGLDSSTIPPGALNAVCTGPESARRLPP